MRLTISAHKDNPVVRTQDDYNQLRDAITAVEDFGEITLLADRVICTFFSRQTYRYSMKPSIEWLVGKFMQQRKYDLAKANILK